MSLVVPDDCRRCGACCHGTTRHVRVDGKDYERLGDDAEALVVWLGARAFLRLASVEGLPGGVSRCAQLLEWPEEGSAAFACAIYERRPSPCRDLERGSPACVAVLESVARARSPERP